MAQNKEKLFTPEDFDKNTSSGESEELSTNGNGKAKWYVAALAGLLVLGGGGYYLSQQRDDGNTLKKTVVDPPKSVVAKGTEASDANKNEHNQSVVIEETTDKVSKEVAEGEVTAQSEQSPSKATPTNDNATTPSSTDTPVRNNPPTAGAVSQAAPTTTVNVTGTVEEEAIEVIRGKYGNGDVRKRLLGDRYDEIQNKVNEMYRKGLVH